MQIRVVTINTWKCDGNYYKRINELALQLSKLDADIIACQECFMSEAVNADTLKFLADKLHMHYTFARGRVKDRLLENNWIPSSSNLGILSFYPITETHVYDLPCNEEDTDRKILYAKIAITKDRSLELFNTHLTHLTNSPLKELQFEALITIINANKTNTVQLICGDFNSTINSKNLIDFAKNTSAMDCYQFGNGEEPRYSLVEEYVKGKQICVDHIFAIRPKNERIFSCKNSGVVLDSKGLENNLYSSDHFGIATTLLFN
ncbi:MAG: endonuclease/exonuclease/phosphatase family protein [Cyclobacteriaceae bacterium]